MKNRLLSMLTFFLIVNIHAQEMPEIVPPSPEAAALSKFTDVPVSHYTGVPNISVPIYTIQTKGISIPISLSYHARGIQVSQMAPRTGLGWSLTYGGSVSRQVRGKGDDAGGQFTYFGNKLDFINYAHYLQTRETVAVREALDPSYDYFPDQFSFNAGGISGKFIFDYNDLEPVIQSYGDVKITKGTDSEGGINAFVITDSKGVKYYFGVSKDGQREALEYQDSQGISIFYNGVQELDPVSTSSDRVYSAWKLMDIETPSGELISYFYEGPTGGNSASIYYRKAMDKHITDATVTNPAANMGDITKIVTRLSKTWSYEKQLTKIEFNQGRDSIVFTKANQIREDFNDYALENISVYHKSKLIKAFKLNYTYTTSTDQTNVLSHLIGTNHFNQSLKRLFLESVEEENSLGEALPPYEFTYDHSEPLPSLYSSRQDYWGYYNGATNNGPFTRLFEYGLYTPDRRVDTIKSEIGMLKEIKYPTGGKTKLTYEHNRGRLPYYFSTLKIPSINPGAIGEVQIVLKKDDFLDAQNNFVPYNLNIPEGTVATFIFNCFHLQYEGQDPVPDCMFYFSLNGSTINYGNDSTYELGEEISFYSNEPGGETASIGAFPLSGIPSSLYLDPLYDFEIIIRYDTPDLRNNIYAAGKRIQKIENIDENGNVLTKEFEYYFPISTEFPDPTPSGGIIGLSGYLNANVSGEFLVYSHLHSEGGAFSTFQPNSIGYSSVIEYHGTKTNNIGKTEYLFTNMVDTGGDYYEFPYHPPTDNEWLRGKNISTKVYKTDTNGNYTLVKEVYNKYLYGDNEYTADFEYFGLQHPSFVFTPDATYHDWTENNTAVATTETRTLFELPLFMRQRYEDLSDLSVTPGYRIYHLTGGTVNLLRTTEKTYNDNGTIENTTTYSYDYNKHYQSKSSTTVDSHNDELTTTFYYPTDVAQLAGISNEASIAADSLLLNNRFEVLETRVQKNLNQVSKLRTNYKVLVFNPSQPDEYDIVIPKTVETLKGSDASGSIEERLTYHEYNDEGNIVEVSKKDGIHVVYIWGYDKTLPIAKIENATYTEVSGFIANLQLLSSGDNDSASEATLRQALNNLRAALSNAMVTTFTYDPLVGVTSMTNPQGQVIYYEYDNFNRLKEVKDADGKVLSHNVYHYKRASN